MEKIIKVIIEADRHARERVHEITSQRYQLSSILEEQRHELTKHFEEVSKQKKAEYQAQLEAQLCEHAKNSDKKYEEIAQALDVQFQTHKDHWIQEIYQHCLKQS